MQRSTIDENEGRACSSAARLPQDLGLGQQLVVCEARAVESSTAGALLSRQTDPGWALLAEQARPHAYTAPTSHFQDVRLTLVAVVGLGGITTVIWASGQPRYCFAVKHSKRALQQAHYRPGKQDPAGRAGRGTRPAQPPSTACQ
jgi:hypothetical protein